DGVNVLCRQTDVLTEPAGAIIARVRRVDVAVDEVAAALRIGDPTDIPHRDEPAAAGVVRRKLLLWNTGVAEQARGPVEGLDRPLRVGGLALHGGWTAPIREHGAITDHKSIAFLNPGILVTGVASLETGWRRFCVCLVVFRPHADKTPGRRAVVL